MRTKAGPGRVTKPQFIVSSKIQSRAQSRTMASVLTQPETEGWRFALIRKLPSAQTRLSYEGSTEVALRPLPMLLLEPWRHVRKSSGASPGDRLLLFVSPIAAVARPAFRKLSSSRQVEPSRNRRRLSRRIRGRSNLQVHFRYAIGLHQTRG